MNEHNDSLLVAEYALGLLEHTEAAEFEQRLKSEPELRSSFISWSEHFAALYEEVDEVNPPANMKARIHGRLFTDIKTDQREVPPKSSPWFWPVNWVSGLVLASLIGFIYHQSQQVLFQADYRASLETEDQSLQVVASYDQEQSLLQVSLTKAVPAAGRSHELWLIAGNNPPLSLGVLSVISQQNIALPDNLSSVIIGSTLAISDEPAGGSPTGSPTGAVLTTAKVIGI